MIVGTAILGMIFWIGICVIRINFSFRFCSSISWSSKHNSPFFVDTRSWYHSSTDRRSSRCLNCYYYHIMMLGSKGFLPPMIPRIVPHNPKNIRNPPCSGYFLMFCGSQSHAFSCKHETHDLLTLVLYYMKPWKSSNKYLTLTLRKPLYLIYGRRQRGKLSAHPSCEPQQMRHGR